MTANPDDPSDLSRLHQKARLEERPFTSATPVIGGLIVWFRNAWNSVATKWYVRPLLDQQSEVNLLLVEQLAEAERLAAERLARLNELELRLIEQDREQVRLTREVAELTAALAQLERPGESGGA